MNFYSSHPQSSEFVNFKLISVPTPSAHLMLLPHLHPILDPHLWPANAPLMEVKSKYLFLNQITSNAIELQKCENENKFQSSDVRNSHADYSMV